MSFFQRGRRTWVYAASSTGRYRGTLNLGFAAGRVQVYEAIGPARAIFMDRLGPEVVAFLNKNGASLQESGSFVDLSLFMMGKSPLRTKPMLMVVSLDKNTRVEAFNMIKQSGIMDAYPGFDLGNMDLRAEFENLQPLADTSAAASLVVRSGDLASKMAHKAERDVHSADPHVVGMSLTGTHSNKQKEVYTGSYKRTGAMRLVYQEQDEGRLDTRSATAGGIVSYQGRYMVQSVNHFLDSIDTAQLLSAAPDIDSDSSPDCEVTGLSDFEDDDEDDLTEITSRESMTPRSAVSQGSQSQTEGSDTASVFSSASAANHADFVASITQRLDNLTLRDALPPRLPEELISVGHVALSSSSRDFSLIELNNKLLSVLSTESDSALRSTAIPLESYREHIEEAPGDAAVRTTTPTGGVIGGTLSGTSSFVLLPGGKSFQEVYVGKLNRPLVHGDCGSWISDAVSGKLYGHVIAGSPTTGLVMVMPARHSFAEALASLTAASESLQPSGLTSPRLPHLGEAAQVHQCLHCQKYFARRCDLNKHAKSHGRPYKCCEPNCAKGSEGWRTPQELERHINDKHCPKPKSYHCSYRDCLYQSKRESNCRQHMEKVHGLTYVRGSVPVGVRSNNNATAVHASKEHEESAAILFDPGLFARDAGDPQAKHTDEYFTTSSADVRSDKEAMPLPYALHMRPPRYNPARGEPFADISDLRGQGLQAFVGWGMESASSGATDVQPYTDRPVAEGHIDPGLLSSDLTSVEIITGMSTELPGGVQDWRFMDSRPPQFNSSNVGSWQAGTADSWPKDGALSPVRLWTAPSFDRPTLRSKRPLSAEEGRLASHAEEESPRPFRCVFSVAGCMSSFSSKNEWKRHVSEQHVQLDAFAAGVTPGRSCTEKRRRLEKARSSPGSHIKLVLRACGYCSQGKDAPNEALFNRKDLYMRHLQATKHVAPVQTATTPKRPTGLRMRRRLGAMKRPHGHAPDIMMGDTTSSDLGSPHAYRDAARWLPYGPGIPSSPTGWQAPHLGVGRYNSLPPKVRPLDHFPCLRVGCGKLFCRKADLERHMQFSHREDSPVPMVAWDYRRCPRLKDPFHRKDHFRDHVRDFSKDNTIQPGTVLRGTELSLGLPRVPGKVARTKVGDGTGGRSQHEEIGRLSDIIHMRDISFIIDNEPPSRQDVLGFWKQTMVLLRRMNEVLYPLDADGLDIYFVKSGETGGHSREPSRFRFDYDPTQVLNRASDFNDNQASTRRALLIPAGGMSWWTFLDAGEDERLARHPARGDAMRASRRGLIAVEIVRPSRLGGLADASSGGRRRQKCREPGPGGHRVCSNCSKRRCDNCAKNGVQKEVKMQLLGLSGTPLGDVTAGIGAAELLRVVMELGSRRTEKAEKGGSRIIVVVPDFTGDVLNAGMAVEKARAAGLKVDLVTVGVDV